MSTTETTAAKARKSNFHVVSLYGQIYRVHKDELVKFAFARMEGKTPSAGDLGWESLGELAHELDDLDADQGRELLKTLLGV